MGELQWRCHFPSQKRPLRPDQIYVGCVPVPGYMIIFGIHMGVCMPFSVKRYETFSVNSTLSGNGYNVKFIICEALLLCFGE